MAPSVVIADPVTVPVTNTPGQICPPVGGQVLIYNADLTNIAYVGYSSSIGVGNSTPIQPLTFIVMDGRKAIYGFCPTVTPTTGILLNITPGATSQSPSPAQIAAQIALSGVSLLSASAIVTQFAATAIGAGAVVNLGPFPITQPGYEIGITFACQAGSTTPFLVFLMSWVNNVTGATVAQEEWVMSGGNTTNQTYVGTGPTNGNSLKITVTNQDTIAGDTYSLTLSQNSRTYVRHDWRQITNAGVPTFAVGNRRVNAGLLFTATLITAANNSSTLLTSLYAGKVSLVVDNSTSTGTPQIALIANLAVTLASQGVYTSPTIAANALFHDTLDLPRGICTIVITNKSGANPLSTNVSIWVSEQLI